MSVTLTLVTTPARRATKRRPAEPAHAYWDAEVVGGTHHPEVPFVPDTNWTGRYVVGRCTEPEARVAVLHAWDRMTAMRQWQAANADRFKREQAEHLAKVMKRLS